MPRCYRSRLLQVQSPQTCARSFTAEEGREFVTPAIHRSQVRLLAVSLHHHPQKWPALAGVLPTRAVVLGRHRQNPPGASSHSAKGPCKPNSVVGPVARPSCGHSSRRRVTADTHQRPTRRFRHLLEPPGRIGPIRNTSLALGPRFPPYLVLLRVGFTLPPASQPERCALTAPFHPYRDQPSRRTPFRPAPHLPKHVQTAVCFLWHWPSVGLETHIPDVIRHTALRSSDFPPPAARSPRPPAATARSPCQS
jgi:hypothetical protein